jgi:hypothetical protein
MTEHIGPYPAQILFRSNRGKSFNIKTVRKEFPQLSRDESTFVDDELARVRSYDPGFPADVQMLLAHSLEQSGSELILTAGIAPRKQLAATTKKGFIERFGEQRARYGVSMLAITITKDKRVVLGVRKAKIRYPNQRHAVPAGRLEKHQQDPRSGILGEYREELGINPDELTDLDCIGVVKDQVEGSMSYEFVFEGRVNLTAREVIQRALEASSRDEHPVLEAFKWDDPNHILQDVLLPEPSAWPPTGFSAVCLALAREYGDNYLPLWEPTTLDYRDYMGRRAAMLGIT